MSEQKPAQTATADDSSANQQPGEAAVLAGPLTLIAFVLFLAASLFHAGPQQMCEEQAAQTPAPRDAGADQQADEAPILVAGTFFAFFLISLVFAGVGSFLHAVAEQVSQHETAQAAPARDARSDQEAHKTALVIAAAFFAFLVCSFFLAACFLSSLAEHMREQQPA
jgi:ABC-type Fe3+ transport system permease subunit